MDTAAVVLGVITIAAIIVGPIAALWVQRKLDEGRDTRKRKLWIFKTLMSNRATRLSPQYVQALNLIDVEFTAANPKEKGVRDAWKELNDLYSNYKETPNAADKATELNAVLLAAMGKSLGYDFDKVYLKKGAYYPEFLGNIEFEQHALRRALLELLGGKRRIPVGVFEEKFAPIRVPKIEATLGPQSDIEKPRQLTDG
ncbi:MAG TPA: DUF6680 family protein [Terriglobales bacterium]|nr:DUF6680 family protein [Terriglobales bacterium]